MGLTLALLSSAGPTGPVPPIRRADASDDRPVGRDQVARAALSGSI